MKWSLLAFFCLANISQANVNLEFNTVVSGITDVNGLGTGFTTRLPGSSTVSGNDSRLELQTDSSQLKFTGQFGDWGYTVENLDLPAITFNGFPGPASVDMGVKFKDVNLDHLDTNIGLFVGTDVNNVLILSAAAYYNPAVGGADGSYQVSITTIKNGVYDFIDLPAVYPAHSDLTFDFGRNDVLTKDEWVGSVSIDDVWDAQFPNSYSFGGYNSTIYTGIFNFNGDTPSGIRTIDVDRFYFTATTEQVPWGWPDSLVKRPWNAEIERQTLVVPEPSSFLLLSFGLLFLKRIWK